MTSHPLTLRIAAGVTAATTLLGVLSLPAVVGAAPPAEAAARAETVPGRVVVSWERGTSAAERAEIRGRHGAEVAERVDALGVEVLRVPPHAAERVIAALGRQDGVAFAEPDFVMASAASDPELRPALGPAQQHRRRRHRRP